MKRSLTLLLFLGMCIIPVRAEESPDSDGDGLTDAEEAVLGTDPANIDSDGDTLTDGQEIELGTDPLLLDTDGDGLDDALDTGWTDPTDIDSDGDGLTDGSEVIEHYSDPLAADTDSDSVVDSTELGQGSDALVTDSDGDGLFDGTELAVGLDSTSGDSAGNGMGDAQSIVSASHPAVSLQPVGSPHQIQFTALPYVSYDVLFSTDLKTWGILTQINSSTQPTAHSVAEPVANQPKGFFNLKPH